MWVRCECLWCPFDVTLPEMKMTLKSINRTWFDVSSYDVNHRGEKWHIKGGSCMDDFWIQCVKLTWKVIICLLRKRRITRMTGQTFPLKHIWSLLLDHNNGNGRKTHFFSLGRFSSVYCACMHMKEGVCVCDCKILVFPINPMRHKAQSCDPLSSFEIYQPVKALLSPALYTFPKRGIHGGPDTISPPLTLCLC